MKYDEGKYPMIWKRATNRGYCFTARIPCRAIERVGKRIQIAALLVDGSERLHLVKEESLEHSPCECFAHCRALERLPVATKAPKIGAGRWKIEGSHNRFEWEQIASFHSPEIAQSVFDLELELEGWLWIRLVDPKGTVQERALTQKVKA
jgi:hypothetical protein